MISPFTIQLSFFLIKSYFHQFVVNLQNFFFKKTHNFNILYFSLSFYPKIDYILKVFLLNFHSIKWFSLGIFLLILTWWIKGRIKKLGVGGAAVVKPWRRFVRWDYDFGGVDWGWWLWYNKRESVKLKCFHFIILSDNS